MFNVRGLSPASVPSKVPYVSDLLTERNQLFMGITETWLNSHTDAELKIEGYKLFRSDRVRKKRGKKGSLSDGVAAYVQDEFASQMEQKFKYSNGVVEMLGLYSKSDNIFIVILYRQPDDSTGGNRSTVNELRPAIDKLQQEINSFGDPAPNIVICGDFNLPNSSWGDTTSSVPYEREMFDCINQLSNDNFLQQLVTQSTHRGGNTLDLVFTNNDHLIHSHECIKPPLASTSDHYIIECKSCRIC